MTNKAFFEEIEEKTGSRKCGRWIVYFDPLLFESRGGGRPAGLIKESPIACCSTTYYEGAGVKEERKGPPIKTKET